MSRPIRSARVRQLVFAQVSLGLWSALACSSTETSASSTSGVIPLDPASQQPVPEEANLTDQDDVPSERPVAAEPAILEDPSPDPASEEPNTLTETTACASTRVDAVTRRRPVDVLMFMDNSASMDDEAAAIERHINTSLAGVLDSANVDYRLLLVSRFATTVPDTGYRGLCIDPPLGPTPCEERPATASPHGERFVHFDTIVNSINASCKLLTTMHEAPEDSIVFPSSFPGDPETIDGLASKLRLSAFKAVVVFSDDHVNCDVGELSFGPDRPELTALELDTQLLESAPEHFGTKTARNYVWHSVVGIGYSETPFEAYPPSAPVNPMACPSAENPGLVYQELSKLTGGLRYSVCNTDGYDAVFEAIAANAITKSSIPCEWDIPNAPPGETFDKDRINLVLRSADDANLQLTQVDGVSACDDSMSWYYDNADSPKQINSCPAACKKLTEASEAHELQILFGCQTQVRTAK